MNFVRSTKQLPTFDYLRNKSTRRAAVLETIFSSIGEKNEALPSLSIESMAHAHDEIGLMEPSEHFDLLSEQIYKLGEVIHDQLLSAKAYVNGKLLYQQSSWLGDDLVVERIDNYTRQDLIVGEPVELDEEIPF